MTLPGAISVITARGGSKGIEGKNTVSLGGKPLIQWTIDASLKSKSVLRTIVSTDDENIAEISRNCGAEVPFIRPTELSGDDAPHIPVMVHAIEWLKKNWDVTAEYFILLQPTSPLRNSEDIDGAVGIAVNNSAESVVAVNETHDHPYLTKRLGHEGKLIDFMDSGHRSGSTLARRQTFEPAYVVNGSIFVNRRNMLLKQRAIISEISLPYFMPRRRSIQIDDSWDLQMAELILRDTL